MLEPDRARELTQLLPKTQQVHLQGYGDNALLPLPNLNNRKQPGGVFQLKTDSPVRPKPSPSSLSKEIPTSYSISAILKRIIHLRIAPFGHRVTEKSSSANNPLTYFPLPLSRTKIIESRKYHNFLLFVWCWRPMILEVFHVPSGHLRGSVVVIFADDASGVNVISHFLDDTEQFKILRKV